MIPVPKTGTAFAREETVIVTGTGGTAIATETDGIDETPKPTESETRPVNEVPGIVIGTENGDAAATTANIPDADVVPCRPGTELYLVQPTRIRTLLVGSSEPASGKTGMPAVTIGIPATGTETEIEMTGEEEEAVVVAADGMPADAGTGTVVTVNAVEVNRPPGDGNRRQT